MIIYAICLLFTGAGYVYAVVPVTIQILWTMSVRLKGSDILWEQVPGNLNSLHQTGVECIIQVSRGFRQAL